MTLFKPNDSDWSSPCILVPKPNGSYRCCLDLKQVNTLSTSDSYPFPRIHRARQDCTGRICQQV